MEEISAVTRLRDSERRCQAMTKELIMQKNIVRDVQKRTSEALSFAQLQIYSDVTGNFSSVDRGEFGALEKRVRTRVGERWEFERWRENGRERSSPGVVRARSNFP